MLYLLDVKSVSINILMIRSNYWSTY